MNINNLQNEIKDYQRIHNFNDERLAKEFGISRKTLSRILETSEVTKTETLAKILQKIGKKYLLPNGNFITNNIANNSGPVNNVINNVSSNCEKELEKANETIRLQKIVIKDKETIIELLKNKN